MNRNVLAAVLVLQLVLVAVLVAVRSTAPAAPGDLLGFDPTTIDRISISNTDGSVELVSAGDGWRFVDGIPADGAKVEQMLSKLADAGGQWPVATSASAASRFEVTEENHQRRIVLESDGTSVADVFLGTSPGYQRAHARVADDSDVYAITFSNFEAGVRSSDWLDRMLLQAEGDVSVVQREDAFNLSKGSGDLWVSLDGSALDTAEVESLVGRLAGLMTTGVYEGEEALEDPAFTYRLTDTSGAYRLDFYRVGPDLEDYVVVSDRAAGRFEVASYIASQLDVSIDDLTGADDALTDSLVDEIGLTDADEEPSNDE